MENTARSIGIFVFDDGPKPIEECTREELMQVIRYLGDERERLMRPTFRRPLDDWRERCDPLSSYFEG